MKQQDKEKLIRFLPMAVLIAGVGTLTNYNLIYTTIAGIVGALIGHLLFKIINKKK